MSFNSMVPEELRGSAAFTLSYTQSTPLLTQLKLLPGQAPAQRWVTAIKSTGNSPAPKAIKCPLMAALSWLSLTFLETWITQVASNPL